MAGPTTIAWQRLARGLLLALAVALSSGCPPAGEGPRATTAPGTPAPTATASVAPATAASSPAVRPLATPTGEQPTTIVEYQPAPPPGAPLTGACWTNSLTVPSRAAWRCEAEGRSLEPCFALDSTSLVCAPNPLADEPGRLVVLRQPLPRPDLIAEKPNSAWLLGLADGSLCTLLPGATALVDGKRISYSCTARPGESDRTIVVLGEPRQGSTWQVERAALVTRDGRYAAASTATVAVRSVVRPPAVYTAYGCNRLAEALGAVLGADLGRAVAPFVDPLSGERGSGCLLSGTGVSSGQPAESVGRLLVGQGWLEELGYRDPAGSAAWRRAGVLCLLSPGRGLNLACARDRATAPAGQTLLRAPEQVMFPYMGTEGHVQGNVAAGQLREYLLTIAGGQTMILDLKSSSPDVFLTVAGWDDERALVRPSANARRWFGTLPGSQDYLVTVAARGAASDFSLDITIPETLAPTKGGEPVVLRRQLQLDQRAHFLVLAEAGAQLGLRLTAGDGKAALSVRGVADGRPLLSASGEQSSWTTTIPTTQPYLVELSAQGTPTRYELAVRLD